MNKLLLPLTLFLFSGITHQITAEDILFDKVGDLFAEMHKAFSEGDKIEERIQFTETKILPVVDQERDRRCPNLLIRLFTKKSESCEKAEMYIKYLKYNIQYGEIMKGCKQEKARCEKDEASKKLQEEASKKFQENVDVCNVVNFIKREERDAKRLKSLRAQPWS